MPPLSDSPTRYQPSPVTTAANRILAAYLAHHRISAVEAARLAVRVESLLAELVTGRPAEVAPLLAPAESEATPRRLRKAPLAKTPRARLRPAAVTAAEEQAVFDLGAAGAVESEAEAAPVAEVPPALEAPAAAAPVVVVAEEIDLLTGGPLPPATEPDDLAQAAVSGESSSGTAAKKRKRPPRPASRRRAARVAAIEQLLAEGEEPPEG